MLARFIPIVRTFLNPLLGTAGTPGRTFALWNLLGAVLWGAGMPLLGYQLGQVSWIGHNLEVLAVLIVLLSVMPLLLETRRHRRA